MTCDIGAIKSRADSLAELERTGRPLVLSFGAMKEWPIGDGILATLVDVQSLAARVEELEAALASRSHEPDPLRAAVIGILRADGYEVAEPWVATQSPTSPVVATPAKKPTKRMFETAWLKSDEIGLPGGWGGAKVLRDRVVDRGRWSTHHEIVFRLPDQAEPFAWRAEYSEGSTEVQDEAPWQYTEKVECTLVRLAPVMSEEWIVVQEEPLTPTAVDMVQGEMLGEDEPDDYGPEDPAAESNPRGAGVIVGTSRICPSCEKPLPPDGKCRSPYVDCQKGTSLNPIENGSVVRIVNGLWDGHLAVALGTISDHGHRHCVEVMARGTERTATFDIAASSVWVVNPGVDEPIAKTGPIRLTDPPTAAEAPAAKARTRAEELPVSIADWSLTNKDLVEVATKLGRTVDEVKRLVAAFKTAMKDRPPTPRWRPAFTAWAAKNAAAVLAQATIPDA